MIVFTLEKKTFWAFACLAAISWLAMSTPVIAQQSETELDEQAESLPKPVVKEAPPDSFTSEEPEGEDDSSEGASDEEMQSGEDDRSEASVLRPPPVGNQYEQLDHQSRSLPHVTHHSVAQYRNVSSGTGHYCRQCADRTGRNAGLIGGFGITHGVGPCSGKNCECWQCPHNAPFQTHGPGDYAGPARTHRLPEYRLRTGDSLQLTYLVAPMKMAGAYRLVVGDELMIESVADEDLQRGTMAKGLKIQPDGTISLRLIGQVHAAGQSVGQLRDMLEELYKEFYPKPSIDVTPVNTGTAARQVREAISGAGGFDPQSITQTITPEGEIRLPRIGSVQAQGLTMDELKEEINLRYDDAVGGLEVEPSLQSQAPHYFFVLGECRQPGRYNMDTPTTVLGAIAMAGGQTVGANLRQVVIFRRGDDWELVSTLMDLRGAVLGRNAHPKDEIWLRDGDVIILPEAPIELFNNFVQQVFTEGIYGIIPLSASYNFGDSFN